VNLSLAQTYHVPEPRDERELELGVQALRAFITGFPKHAKALEAEYWIGLAFFNQQRYADAQREFEQFLKQHAKEPENPVGAGVVVAVAMGAAVLAAAQAIPTSPTPSDRSDASNDPIPQARYHLGLALLRQKRPDAAIAAWEQFLRDHPVHRLWNTV